ncbi:MAG: hypothetical protein ACLT8E_11415 [Akkermansia sp.]
MEMKAFINLRFGRVLNVYLPEVTGTGADMSVADLLAAARKERKNWKRPCWNATSSIP